MKLASVLAGLAGLALIGALLVHFGAASVARSLWAIGAGGFAAICVIHLALIALMGVAWAMLLPGLRPRVGVWARLVRDSASEVLPLSQLGGYVLGARALVVAAVPGSAAAASTIVDVALEFFAQLAYTAIGLFWLLHLDPRSRAALPVGLGLAVALALAAGFFFAQRRGFGGLDRMAAALGRGWAEKTAAGAAALHAAIGEIYRRPAAVWGSFLLHLFCWVASAAEIWLALRLMGVPRGFGVVLVIESLLYAVRSIAFAVPNAVGVQEGAYILLGAGFGLTPAIALALSLVKRGRDLAIGLPVLGVYQLTESRRLWRRAAPAEAPASRAVEMAKPPAEMAGGFLAPLRRKRRDRLHRRGGPSEKHYDARR